MARPGSTQPPRAAQRARQPGAAAGDGGDAIRLGDWLRELRVSGVGIVVITVLLVAVVVLAPGLRTLVQQQQQIAQLSSDVADAQQSVTNLNAEIARWSDPAYVESQARDRLYYVMPGETAYLVVGGDHDAASDDPVSRDVQQAQPDWVSALLGTWYGAGLTTETPDQLEQGQARGTQ